MAKNANAIFFSLLFAAVLITSIVLFACSWGALDENEMGLDWNRFNHKIGDLYSSGRYMIGLNHQFIKFPTDLINIEFTSELDDILDARSMDGLKLNLAVTFQYRLTKDEASIKALYKKFGNSYDDEFAKIAKFELRNEASRYEAFSYFQNRSTISATMRDRLAATFKDYGVTIEGFQLVDIELPAEFGKAVEETEIAKQAIEVAENRRASLLVSGATRVANARRTAIEIEQAANATALAIRSKGEATAEAISYAIEKETLSFAALKDNLNMTSAELLDYMFIKKVSTVSGTMNLRLDIPASLTV